MIVTCLVVSVQPLQASNGEWINFPNTTVGQTSTANFTYTLLESSATSAMITVNQPLPPFSVEGPLTFTLNPGQSRTLSVTFTPTAAQGYEGSFTISAIGGMPPQVKTTTVGLSGQGVGGSESSPTIIWPWSTDSTPTVTPETTDASDDIAKLEAKLDVYGPMLTDLRQRLEALGWWLGRLTNGAPLRLGPQDTNPIPQTNTWDQLAKLEAKLDSLLAQPSEITIIQIYDLIVQINILMIEVNQWVINLGGNVAGLEAKLDYFLEQPGGITIVEVYDIIVEINILIVNINQLIINVGGDVDKLEAKLDELSADLDQLSDDLFDLSMDLMDMWLDMDDMRAEMDDRFDNVENAIAANTRAINDLQDSNNRIEDKLNELLRASGLPAPPSAPVAAKITLTMGGGPLPAAPWEATVEGVAGAAESGALVTIYWPLGVPSTITASVDGSFLVTVISGNAAYLSVEVTQTVGGYESARVRVTAS